MKKAIHVMILLTALATLAVAQNPPAANVTPVQATLGLYYTTPATATAATGSPAVLTISAPAAGLYNYVCSLSISGSNAVAAVLTNVVTTSTNFNTFALKFSQISATNNSYDWAMKMGEPSTGCAKSTSPGTATTFTSPTTANWAYNWIATYFVAP